MHLIYNVSQHIEILYFLINDISVCYVVLHHVSHFTVLLSSSMLTLHWQVASKAAGEPHHDDAAPSRYWTEDRATVQPWDAASIIKHWSPSSLILHHTKPQTTANRGPPSSCRDSLVGPLAPSPSIVLGSCLVVWLQSNLHCSNLHIPSSNFVPLFLLYLS